MGSEFLRLRWNLLFENAILMTTMYGQIFLAQVGVFRDDLNYKSLEELCHSVLSLSVTIKGVSNDYRYTDIVSSHVFIAIFCFIRRNRQFTSYLICKTRVIKDVNEDRVMRENLSSEWQAFTLSNEALKCDLISFVHNCVKCERHQITHITGWAA